MAYVAEDPKRAVPVVGQAGQEYSGFHQGGGETTIAELLKADFSQYSLVLIDEIESSLHPRVQRRLIRDLATKCRERELQVILTTHSPYVLDELPSEARAYIMVTHSGSREIVYGVSPEFAMTKMDEVPQHECDLYVEDQRAATMLMEILAYHHADLVLRCRPIICGPSSVGQALGQMVAGKRFPGPSCVFLDGDQGQAPGCLNLPGEDAPERVVFSKLRERSWVDLANRINREFSTMVDAMDHAMTLTEAHDWVRVAGTALVLGGEELWRAMCQEWAKECLSSGEALTVTQPIEDALSGVQSPVVATSTIQPGPVPPIPTTTSGPKAERPSPSELPTLFSRSPDGAQE
jgi:putative AbiEii toxin of type IV toxin-antitoxin system